VESLLELTAKRHRYLPTRKPRGYDSRCARDVLRSNLLAKLRRPRGPGVIRCPLQSGVAESHPRDSRRFFEQTVRYVENQSHIFTMLVWMLSPTWPISLIGCILESVDRLRPHKSGKRIICGHFTTAIRPNTGFLDFALCLDTVLSTADG